MRVIATLSALVLVIVLLSTSSFTHTRTTPLITPCLELLTGKKWELKQIRFLQDNSMRYFNLEDTYNSNIILDGDFYLFNQDGTGTYHQGDGMEYSLTWKYLNERRDAIQFINNKFRDDADLYVTWEHIKISNGEINYVEYYTHANGTNSLGYGIRTSSNSPCDQDTKFMHVNK